MCAHIGHVVGAKPLKLIGGAAVTHSPLEIQMIKDATSTAIVPFHGDALPGSVSGSNEVSVSDSGAEVATGDKSKQKQQQQLQLQLREQAQRNVVALLPAQLRRRARSAQR